MRVIVFSGKEYPAQEQLVEIVRLTACFHKTEILHTLSGFFAALTHCADREAVAVALLAGPEELEALLPLREISMDIPLILVLPDSRPGTISLGHRLRPRFLGFLQNDFSEVTAVLAEVLKRNRRDGETGMVFSTY